MTQSLDEKRQKHAEYMREWRAKNREHNLAYNRKYYQKNRERIRFLAKLAWQKKKDKINANRREQRKRNPKKFRVYDRERYRKNPQKILEKNKRCLKKHREEYLKKKQEYNHDHLEEMRGWRRRNRDHLLEYNRNKRSPCKPYQFARKDRCEVCSLSNQGSIENYGRRLDIHHFDGNLLNNSAKNLVTLCRGCHGKVLHSFGIKIEEQISIPVVE